MARTNPELWQLPKWHPDCDGDFLFAGLRTVANALLSETDLDAKLAIIEDGYARLEVFDGKTPIGLVYVSRANRGDKPPAMLFTVYAGADDDELTTTDVAAAVGFLDARRTALPRDVA